VLELATLHERPAEYERMKESGDLERLAAPAPSRRLHRLGRTFGTIAVTIGFVFVALIVYALL